MAEFATLNLNSHIKDSTREPIQFTYLVDTTPIDLTGASVDMEIVNGNVTFSFSTSNGKIAITDAINGKFVISPGVVHFPVANYNYTITVTFLNGAIKTYIVGKWRIVDINGQ